jgi:hypothetical protein
MIENKHIQAIPANILAEAQSHIDATNALLKPFVIALTPAERHDVLKMGDKTLSFVEKAFDFVKKSPELAPSYLDINAFEIDKTDATGLRVLLNSAKQLEESLDDTVMVAGSESFKAALVFYNSVKQAAEQDVPGAKSIYEDMKTRFPRTKRKISE